MACGYTGASHPKSYHAPIVAGNTVSVNYSVETIDEELGRPWTFGHPIGPMLAYMAACPDEGCEAVDLKAPIWLVLHLNHQAERLRVASDTAEDMKNMS